MSNTPTLLKICVVFTISSMAFGRVQINVFNNSALYGAPAVSRFGQDLSLNIPFSDTLGSAEVTGTLTFDQDAMYSFACTFSPDQMVFVWIRDHLVCHTDPPFGNSPSSTDGCPENPLPGKKGEVNPLVIHVYNLNTSNSVIDVQWARLSAPMAAGSSPATTTIPESVLGSELPALEVQRRTLQNSLKMGWSTWSYNMLSVIRLPDSGSITTGLCQISTQKCLLQTRIEDTAASIRVGVFATDLSYWQFYVGYAGINVSLSYAGGVDNLMVLAEPQNCAMVNCSDYALVVMPRFAWFRKGDVICASDSASCTLKAMGMDARTMLMTAVGQDIPLPETVKETTHIAVAFDKGPVGAQEITTATSTKSKTMVANVSDIRKVIAANRAREYAGYAKYGEYAEVKEAVQAATMWNYIYTPAEYGPFLPVSRSWNFVKHDVNSDWSYVIFDWDNIFASYMTSLDSKNIAYSNFIQVIRSKTARGMVPNFSAGGSKSIDRTEPPIGAKVLLEMYNKYKDKWLVELLFDDLLAWNTWFVNERMFGPLGIVSLGSDTFSGYNDFAPGTMQGARFESGLDNSPMYDGEFFNNNVSHDGSFTIGQMELYDVGMASMFVSEAESLASLATIMGDNSTATSLQARAAAQRSLITQHLWDSNTGIYTNKFWNGSFYSRISPTSFYSMLASAATDQQATAMVQNWLHSPDHFCIAPNGDFKGNHDHCYWGLPSIQASDPAFPPLGYWRGYVWGPMAQLTYWSLQNYDHVEVVRNGRKALCKQMTALMLSQWHGHRHICENYSPHKTADDHNGDCSGTKFYHWGALTGLITLIENGYY